MAKRKTDKRVLGWVAAVRGLAQFSWPAQTPRPARPGGEVFAAASPDTELLRVVRWFPVGNTEVDRPVPLITVYAGAGALTHEAHTRPSQQYALGVIPQVLAACHMTSLSLVKGDKLDRDIRSWLKNAGVVVTSRQWYPVLLRMRDGQMAAVMHDRDVQRVLALVQQITTGATALVEALAGGAMPEPGDEQIALPVVHPDGAVRLQAMPGPDVLTAPDTPGTQLAALPTGDASWLVGVTDLSAATRKGTEGLGLLTVVAMPTGRAYHHAVFSFSPRGVMAMLHGLMRGDTVEGNLQNGPARAPNPGCPQAVGFVDPHWAEVAQKYFANSEVPWVDASGEEPVRQRVQEAISQGMLLLRDGIAAMEAR